MYSAFTRIESDSGIDGYVYAQTLLLKGNPAIQPTRIWTRRVYDRSLLAVSDNTNVLGLRCVPYIAKEGFVDATARI